MNRDLLLFIFLAGLAQFWALDDPMLHWTGDQKAYLSTALEMWDRGSFGIPYLWGSPSFLKPPLLYVFAWSGWKLFGISLLGTLFFMAFLPAISAYALSVQARELGLRSDPKKIFAIFISFLGVWIFSRTFQMEILLVALSSLASAYAAKAIVSGKFRHWAPAWIFAGLLSPVKSPLYSVLWALSLFLYGVWSGKILSWLKNIKFYPAFLIGVGVGMAWFGWILLGPGAEQFWSQYVVYESWDKQNGNSGSLATLIGGLLGFTFPWFFLFFNRAKNLKTSSWVVAGMVPTLLFFWYYPYKVSTYYFFILPPVALWLASVQYGRIQIGLVLSVFTAFAGFLSVILMRLRLPLQSGYFLFLFFLCAYFIFKILRMDPKRPQFSRTPIWVASLLLLGWIGVGLVSKRIASDDLEGLKQAASAPRPGLSNEKAPIVILDEGKSIWNEWGMLRVGLGLDQTGFKAVTQFPEWKKAVEDGALGVLTETQVLAHQSELAGSQKSQPRFQKKPWARLSKTGGKLKLAPKAYLECALNQEVFDEKIGSVMKRTEWLFTRF